MQRMRREVLPLLTPAVRTAAADLLERLAARPPRTAPLHGDLSADHIRVVAGAHAHRFGGVIDWADVCIGDPARDLAWLLHGTGRAFAAAVADAYGVDAQTNGRARDWYALGPWHQVLFGLGARRPELVCDGVSQVEHRLLEHQGQARSAPSPARDVTERTGDGQV